MSNGNSIEPSHLNGQLDPGPSGLVEPDLVPIVAIGASAGGLEPFEQFFDAMQDQPGIAFVIIQHLSPNFQSMMDELLGRHSNMKIERVIEGLKIEPNTIYLNPPRSEMSLQDGHFKLAKFNSQHLLNMPIDTFFESLADEVGEKAIAIVLSGTGSDGTKGAATIKQAGGIVLAQDLSTAKFDGMPNSVIKKGYADAVGYPAALAEFVSRIVRGQPIEEVIKENLSDDPITEIFRKLRERFGTDFNYYKTATIQRRLERRAKMRSLQLREYVALLATNQDEIDALYGDLLIEVTSFFRDKEAYDVFGEKVVPKLVERMTPTRPLRIWVPGCASGEEAYSLAIMFADYAFEHGVELNLKLLATDIHNRSLDAASAGIYPEASLGGLSETQLERYFERDGSYYQVKQSLRRMVVFSPHNLLNDPPFTRMDLVSCRNVLIYFNDIAQQKTLALFHFALNKNGYLFLGPSEATGKLDNEFETLEQRWRIFRKKRDVRLLEATTLLPSAEERSNSFNQSSMTNGLSTEPVKTLSSPLRQAHNAALKELLRLYAPTGFLLTKEGDVAHVFGEAGSFLHVGNGVFSTKVADLVEDDLKLIVSTGLERLKASDKLSFERRIAAVNEEMGEHSIVIKLVPLRENGNVSDHLLLTLERVPLEVEGSFVENVKTLNTSEAHEILRGRISDLERDLSSTEESLQSTIEELETSNEELQATNEELMASNEELQSTNEELHSVNEELYTVSSEHQRKIEELTESTDDMDHLLKATNIGIIFLDDDLRIRRFTPSATETFNLIYQDIGRPIDHVTYKFKLLDLAEVVQNVRMSGSSYEHEIEVADQTYALRILPYRASLQDVMGAVITTINISDMKNAENARVETTKRFESIVGDLTDIVVRWNANDNIITYCNQPFADVVGRPLESLVGSDISKIDALQDSGSFILSLMDQESDIDFHNEVFAHSEAGEEIVTSGTLRRIYNEADETIACQFTGRVVTPQYRYRQAIERLWELQESASLQPEFFDDTATNFAGDIFNDKAGASPVMGDLPINTLLKIGCDFLKLSFGAVSCIDGENYGVLRRFGPDSDDETETQGIPLAQTYSRHILENESVVSVENWGESDKAGDICYDKYGFEAFIGVLVNTVGSVKWTLSFYDKAAREESFTEDERLFVQYLAQALATLINRKNYHQSLEDQRRHYEDLYNHSPVMMCTVDSNGAIAEVNQKWLSSLNYARSEVLHNNIKQFTPDTHAESIWNEFPVAPDVEELFSKKPTVLVGKDADEIHVEVSAIRHQALENEAHRYLIAFEDVTDRNRAFAEIERQRNELQKANEGLNTFAYVASHDLQEPLRKIRQFAEMLGEDYADKFDDEGEYILNIVTGSAARISSLVRDILDYSMASNSELSLETVDLNGVMQDVEESLKETIECKDVELKIGKLPKITTDSAVVHQVFENLISNAIKYTKEGVSPRIEVSSRQSNDKTTIEFSDNGIGIKQSVGDRIFTPFTRLHDKDKYPGSGLGLAICKIVCDRLGWQISYKKRNSGGTTFSIAIPE